MLQLHGEGFSGREIARRLGVGEATIRRQDASERRAKTPQRGLYEEPGTNPDHGGAEGLVNVGRLGVLTPGTYFSQLGLSGQL